MIFSLLLGNWLFFVVYNFIVLYLLWEPALNCFFLFYSVIIDNIFCLICCGCILHVFLNHVCLYRFVLVNVILVAIMGLMAAFFVSERNCKITNLFIYGGVCGIESGISYLSGFAVTS